VLITYILTRISNKLFRKRYTFQRTAIISFVLVGMVTLGIGSVTMGFVKSFIIYTPCLALWLVIDLLVARKAKE